MTLTKLTKKDIRERMDKGKFVTIDNFLSTKRTNFKTQMIDNKLNINSVQDQRIGIKFLLLLSKKNKDIFKNTICIPKFHICTYNIAYKDNKIPKKIVYYPVDTYKNCSKTKLKELVEKEEIDKTNGFTYVTYKSNLYATLKLMNPPFALVTPKDLPPMYLISPGKHLIKYVKKCKDAGRKLIILYLSLSSKAKNIITGKVNNVNHGNTIIINTYLKTIERFEPHGRMLKIGKLKLGSWDTEKIDNFLKNEFKVILPEYKYITAEKTCPIFFGPQAKSLDRQGTCVTWSTMYMLLRGLNPTFTSEEVIKNMNKGTPSQLHDTILRFNNYIINELSKEDIDLYEQESELLV